MGTNILSNPYSSSKISLSKCGRHAHARASMHARMHAHTHTPPTSTGSPQLVVQNQFVRVWGRGPSRGQVISARQDCFHLCNIVCVCARACACACACAVKSSGSDRIASTCVSYCVHVCMCVCMRACVCVCSQVISSRKDCFRQCVVMVVVGGV